MTDTNDFKASHELPEEQASRIAAIELSFFGAKDINSLTESILLGAMEISRADNGVLYLLDAEDPVLRFECVRSKSLNIFLGGANGEPIPGSFAPIPILKNGKANDSMAIVHVAANNVTLNIGDMMNPECKFALGVKDFVKGDRYPATSMLVVPVRNSAGGVVAILQLTNALDPGGWKPVAFSERSQFLVESLAGQAGVALCSLTKQR